MSGGTTRYRRSPHLVSYWADGQLIFHNFATGARVAGTAITIGLLDYFDTWKAALPLLQRSRLPIGELETALNDLVNASLLQQSGRRIKAAERAMEQWASWNPAAGLLHFSTKDLPFEEGEAHALEFLADRVRTRPIPAATKTYKHHRRVALPRVRPRDSFSRVLLARRTWRRFGGRPLSLARLSVLLHLAFGAQKFMDLGAGGIAMLRTSPSAGARHPLEAYVVVRNVAGVDPGIYHYAPVEHDLVELRKRAGSIIERHLPGQAWYGAASALVLITAVFARTEWKYPSPRAYRDVLLEAGHFCQTFCLAATALHLAPFCTAALADSVIERDLGLDGVTESVLYACGVGSRPPGVEWAPAPDSQAHPLGLFSVRPSGDRRRRPRR